MLFLSRKMNRVKQKPKTWSEEALGNILDINMGNSPPSKSYNETGKGTPFLQGNAEFGSTYPDNQKWTTDPKKISNEGDVLFSVRAPVGDVNLSDKNYCIGRGIAALCGKDGSIAGKFLYYWLIFYRPFFKNLSAGSTFKSVNKSDIENTEILTPPLPEQKKIVKVLDMIQEAIEIQDRLIERTQELKRAVMHKLFTEGTRGEKQKQTKVGKMPEGWEVVSWEEIVSKPQYGFTASAKNEAVGPRFLRISDIQDSKVDWNSVPYCDIPQDKKEKYLLSSGDIVIARIGGTTGKSFFVTNPPEAVYASYLLRVKALSGLEKEYLYYFTETSPYWAQIESMSGGRLKKGVNIGVLQSLEMPLPSEEEQKEITDFLQTIDKKIEIHREKKEKYKELFRSMLHKLMTAEIRVNNLDLS